MAKATTKTNADAGIIQATKDGDLHEVMRRLDAGHGVRRVSAARSWTGVMLRADSERS
jgi:hypothetical protein